MDYFLFSGKVRNFQIQSQLNICAQNHTHAEMLANAHTISHVPVSSYNPIIDHLSSPLRTHTNTRVHVLTCKPFVLLQTRQDCCLFISKFIINILCFDFIVLLFLPIFVVLYLTIMKLPPARARQIARPFNLAG